MAEHTPDPPPRDDTLYHGLYLDAETAGLGATHDRLTALALLAFDFDTEDWIVTPFADDALSGPDPHRAAPAHRPSAAGGDARTPGIDLTRAGALIERAHLVVTHTRRYSRALLEKVVPAIREVPWLEWELGLPDVDESIHLPTPPSRGLAACKSGLWLLAQPDAESGRPMLAVLLAQSAQAPAPPPVSRRLQ